MEVSQDKRNHERDTLTIEKSKQHSNSKLIEEWIFNFSGHGFSNLLREKNKSVKLLWLISILISIGGCFSFIVNSFTQYFSYPIVTTIKVQKVDSLTYPAMTFCGFDNIKNGSTNFNTSSILSCQFGQKYCIDKFESVIIYASGSFRECVRLNGNKSKELLETSNDGYHYGLKINLFLRKEQIAFLNIADNNDIPVDGNFLNYLHPGQQTDVIIKKNNITNLGYPYSDCVKQGGNHDTDLYRETLESDFNYRRQNCGSLCFYKKYIEDCNCSLPNSTFLPNTRFNAGLQPCIRFGQCFKDFSKNFSSHEDCSGCPSECDSVTFETKTEYTQIYEVDESFIQERVNDKFSLDNNSSNFTDWKKNIAVLLVYFEEMRITSIAQSPKEEVSNLISNIGGTLGFFLGLSLLSFIEVIELFLQLIFSMNSSFQNNRKKKSMKYSKKLDKNKQNASRYLNSE